MNEPSPPQNSTDSPDVDVPSPTFSRKGVFSLPWLGLMAVFLILVLIRQPLVPVPWFDEGLNAGTAAMLAKYQHYGLPDSQHARLMDPAIQTGPTVLVPMALLFRWFGPSLELGRVLISSFGLLALGLFLLAARRLTGQYAAIFAGILLLAGVREQFASFISLSRQVLGEIPGLAFFLAGLIFWWSGLDKKKPAPDFLLAGIFWGLSGLTKSQLLIVLPFYLPGLWLANRLYYRQAHWRSLVYPGAGIAVVFGIWYGIQLSILGIDGFLQNSAVLREGVELHILAQNLQSTKNAVKVLWSTGWLFWGVPALIWGVRSARSRDKTGLRHFSGLLFAVLTTVWFVFFSIGWGRYAFYPFVLLPIWFADLFIHAWKQLARKRSGIGRLGLVAFGIGMIAVSIQPLIQDLWSARDTGYLAMSEYLSQHVQPNQVVETWEWEMSIRDPDVFHLPPTHLTNLYTAQIYQGIQVPEAAYDPLAAKPDYLLVGPFATWTGVYRSVKERDLTPIVTFQDYSFYQVNR